MSVKATKKQRKALNEYVRWVDDSLELRDWTLTVVYDPEVEDSDALASIKCIYGRKHANIRLCPEFFSLSGEQQRQTVAHELIHCHLSGLEWQYNNLGGHVAPSVFEIVWGGMKDQVEFATDAMADALAKHLPLPIIPEGKKAA